MPLLRHWYQQGDLPMENWMNMKQCWQWPSTSCTKSFPSWWPGCWEPLTTHPLAVCRTTQACLTLQQQPEFRLGSTERRGGVSRASGSGKGLADAVFDSHKKALCSSLRQGTHLAQSTQLQRRKTTKLRKKQPEYQALWIFPFSPREAAAPLDSPQQHTLPSPQPVPLLFPPVLLCHGNHSLKQQMGTRIL